MEISHASVETQAVALGISGKAEEVTVSTDAEFMMMIAHGIYSNKPLALVRELICNGRDGLSLAGKIDEPIEIKLTDNLLVVRDKGTGIPNGIFAPTYMTFGKSTKRKSKAETGGFGVGTKVPWAVCDTFSARNFINGSMTAYTIMKSDPGLNGKPSCTPIMSIPSAEPSGVEVSVPFPEKMKGDIERMIHLFGRELNIRIILNGTKLWQERHAAWFYDQEELKKTGYIRLNEHPSTVIQQSVFYVRQGDVLYPIEKQAEFSDAWDLIYSIMDVPARNPILFQAEPDSIIPTLSRESLQYTDRTIKSIRSLMKKLLQDLADNIDGLTERTRQKLVPWISHQNDFTRLFYHDQIEFSRCIASIFDDKLADKNLTKTQNRLLFENLKRWFDRQTPYLESKLISAADFRLEIKKQMYDVWVEKVKKYTYLNHERLLELYHDNLLTSYKKNPTLGKALTRNLYEEILFWRAEARYDSNIIDVMLPKCEDIYRFSSSISSYFFEIMQLKDLDTKKEELFKHHTREAKELCYLSNLVVISLSPKTMLQRAYYELNKPKYSAEERRNLFSNQLALLNGCRFVRVKAGLKSSVIDKMAKTYESWGYKVLVLMEPTPEENEERNRLAAERAAMRAIPLPVLHDQILENIRSNNHQHKFDKKRLKSFANSPSFKGEPLFLILPRGKELPYMLQTVDNFVQLGKYLGTDIITVSTKPEIAKAIKDGRRNAEEAMMDIVKWFFKQPGMYQKLYYKETFFARKAKQNRLLTKYLFNRDVPLLTAKEQKNLSDLETLVNLFPSVRDYFNKKLRDIKAACTPAAYYQKLFDDYSDENFCDVHGAFEIAYAKRPSPKRALARSILKRILKERPA